MRFVDEYRDPETARGYANQIARLVTRPWTIMEICGGQTHAIMKYGVDNMLPDTIKLLHGPGCPVCVTPLEMVDKAIYIAGMKNVILCSFGDMLRVPGSHGDLQAARAKGGDIRTVYSPLDALKIAVDNPSQEVVFFAIGFETTAPANAAAVYQAKRKEISNFSMLVSQVLVPPAIEKILASPGRRINGFLAPGHVCTVMGYTEYENLSARFGVPITVTGFEPLDILQGIYMTVAQLEKGRAGVENQYTRGVQRKGNPDARRIMDKVFRKIPRKWRGLGEIEASGLGLKEEYRGFDAEIKFNLADYSVDEPSECISGLVLQGRKKPDECSAFGNRCTPEHPLGATMVSSEGACAAYFHYGRKKAAR